MKKFLILLIAFGFFLKSSAQKDTVHLRNREAAKNTVTDRPPQAIYFQIGGSAPILSINYDRRFSRKLNGLGFAIGLGFWGSSGVSVFSVPLSINYLIGRNNHFVELAAGTAFVSARLNWFDDTESGSTFIQHLNIGYRYQPVHGGFFFRGGISPLFFNGGYLTSYYLGFGHNF